MPANSDDTVIIRAPRGRRRGLALAALAAVASIAVAAGATWSLHRPTAPLPSPSLPVASEAQLRDEIVTARTVLRFAENPAIVVIDFPTLAEQGRMLNRLAAWEERSGVPHDRVLGDADLDAAIRASGATPDTYYYGHDYRAADIARFFATADRQGLALNPMEQELRTVVARAAAEPLGFGALITLPRSDAANQVDSAARATILHHELSHGEYFTNAIYASFVGRVWTGVLTEPERAAFRAYLAAEGYDSALEDLMVNESQAYLMHTPDPRFFDPVRLGIAPERLLQIKQAFVAGMPSCWLRDVTSVSPVPLAAR